MKHTLDTKSVENNKNLKKGKNSFLTTSFILISQYIFDILS